MNIKGLKCIFKFPIDEDQRHIFTNCEALQSSQNKVNIRYQDIVCTERKQKQAISMFLMTENRRNNLKGKQVFKQTNTYLVGICMHICKTLTQMANPSEKFCLKWNGFEQNIVSSFNDLRKDSDFSDVTLVCEKDHQVEAHRTILSACSPFMRTVLQRNKHPHPMIYMRGLTTKDLEAILDFIYHREANIFQEDLDTFLALAEEIQLKGLPPTKENAAKEPIVKHRATKTQRSVIPKQEVYPYQLLTQTKRDTSTNNIDEYPNVIDDTQNMLVPVDTNNKDHKAQLSLMMEKAEDGDVKWKCNVCAKTTKGKDWGIARCHIETHIDGLLYPCNQCGKISRSINGLNNHINKNLRK